jgi:hypothetical protein
LVPGSKKLKRHSADDPLRGVDQARKAITAFFEAGTVEEMAKHVRNPQRALPRMKAHYASHPLRPKKFEFGMDWQEAEHHGLTLILTDVTVDFDVMAMCVEVTESSDGLVDWESWVGWCEMPWSEFVKKGAEKPREFRVRLSRSDYYNFSFADSAKHACFRLTDTADTETVFAYCALGSKPLEQLNRQLHFERLSGVEEGGKAELALNCIVKLTMAAGDVPHRQAVIESFVCEGWVIP